MRKLSSFSLILLALAALLLALAAACGGEEEKGTPTATRTATVVATRTATPAATRTAVATPTRVATATPKPTTAPTPTPTAAETATPTAAVTPAVTPTPVVEKVDGITDTEIILGTHFALSGTWGASFAPVLAGMKAYFKYVNAEEGGVCGRQIDFKIENDEYDPARAVEAIRKLLDEEKVFAIIGGLGTAAHSAVWEELNEKGIPDLWIMSGAHKWGAEPDKYPWSIAILPDYFIEGTIFGKYISENMPGKKVGVLYQNDDFGKDVLDGLKNGLDPTKNELVSEQSYESTAVSIRSQVTNLKNAGAEAVVGACIPPPCAQAIQEADRQGWHPQFFIDYVNSDPIMFQFASPQVMAGTITLQANKLVDETDDPAVAEHHRIMDTYGDMPPSNYAIVGQEAAMLTVDSLRNTCDNLTRQGLMDSIYRTFANYQGPLNLPGITTSLSPTDHLATEAMKMLKATVTAEGKGEWEYFGDIISFR
jgi:branched-chain amino acid transport system substrate-binding protein